MRGMRDLLPRRPRTTALSAGAMAALALSTAAGLAAVAMLAAAPASSVIPGIPSIYVNYNPDCTFSMSTDGGFLMTAGSSSNPTLPPGSYQLVIAMPNPPQGYPCTTPTFTLTGPGLSFQAVFPGAAANFDQPVTLEPGSTYVAEDTNLPGETETTFSTATSGSSLSLVSTPTTRTGSSVTQSDIVGSAITTKAEPATSTDGHLRAEVTGAGASLTLAGHAVHTLGAGRYLITIDDAVPRAGFFLKRETQNALTLAEPSFVGTRTAEVVLEAGAWTYFAEGGHPTSFAVTASR